MAIKFNSDGDNPANNALSPSFSVLIIIVRRKVNKREATLMPVTYSRCALDANAGTGNPYLNRTITAANPNLLWRFSGIDNDWYIIYSRLGQALDANGGTGKPYLTSTINIANQNLHWRRHEFENGKVFMLRPRVSMGSALDANGARIPPQLPYINRSLPLDGSNNVVPRNDNLLWKKIFHGGGYFFLEPKLQSPTYTRLQLPYSANFKDSYRLDAGGIFHIPTPLFRHAISKLRCDPSGQIQGETRLDNEEGANGWSHGVSVIAWNLDGDPMKINGASPGSKSRKPWEFLYNWKTDALYLRDGLRWRFSVGDPSKVAVISFSHVSL